ncbi:substrate-binding periplasmic protein [Fangia hongkongensis]|uniref:substrate-binding periplasmic protein n=2 Tax=Fangia hongkongensis TaxID=270495 RepID=UPI0012B51AC7|nr:transporter substrate-binding domain-containing protein [Fangia hongkongensis]
MRRIIFLVFLMGIIALGLSTNLGIAAESKTDEARHLTLCAEPWPPYDYKVNGQVKGKDVELNRKLFSSLGVKTTITIIPWSQCWKLVASGKIDGALMVSKKKFREKSVYYPSIPVTTAEYVWVTNEHYQARYFDACPNLSKEKLKVGVVKGNSYNSAFLKCLSKSENRSRIVAYPNLETAIRMLMLNKIQLILAIPEIVEYYNQALHRNKVSIQGTPLFTKIYYTVLSKKSSFSHPKYKNIEAVLTAYNEALAKHLQKSMPANDK